MLLQIGIEWISKGKKKGGLYHHNSLMWNDGKMQRSCLIAVEFHVLQHQFLLLLLDHFDAKHFDGNIHIMFNSSNRHRYPQSTRFMRRCENLVLIWLPSESNILINCTIIYDYFYFILDCRLQLFFHNVIANHHL